MSNEPFGYSMNTSTLRNFGQDLAEEARLCAEVGFQAIEPWVRQLEAHREKGGSLDDLRKLFGDLGLAVAGAIAFFKWADADARVRADALEDARRQMELVAAAGGKSIAAPPFGDVADVSLDEMAESFHRLDAVGKQVGVKPILEFWGMAPRLKTLAEALYVAAAAGLPDVRILVDVYHLYKGGSGHSTIRLVNGAAVGIVHINDYPDSPPREEIQDSDRVFPGDGTAPMGQFLRDLADAGYRGMLSLELFNADYGDRSPADVAREGLAKTRAAVQAALEAAD